MDPKDFKVDPYIKKIDGTDFYCISNKMNKAQKKLREIYKQYKNKLNFIETDKITLQNLTIMPSVQLL